MVLRARTVEVPFIASQRASPVPEKGRPFEIFKTAPTSVLFGRPKRVGKGGSHVSPSPALPPPASWNPESVAHCVRAKREVATDICFASRVICGSNYFRRNLHEIRSPLQPPDRPLKRRDVRKRRESVACDGVKSRLSGIAIVNVDRVINVRDAYAPIACLKA